MRVLYEFQKGAKTYEDFTRVCCRILRFCAYRALGPGLEIVNSLDKLRVLFGGSEFSGFGGP